MAGQRRAPADQVLAAQFGQRGHQIGTLVAKPALVLRDHLVAPAVASDHERVCPFRRSKAKRGAARPI